MSDTNDSTSDSDNNGNGRFPGSEYKYDFPCDHKEADDLIRKHNKHKVKLVKILNDDWEEYKSNRNSAVQHLVWHAMFYTGKNPTVVWNVLTGTPVYEKFEGGYVDIKQWVEEIPREEFYGEGPNRPE